MTETPSFVVHTGDGATTDFVFPFPYLDPSHVKVAVDGVEVAFSFIGQNMIRIPPAPAGGTEVRIYRETPGEPMTAWPDGAVILGKDLTLASKQPAYVAQEARDKALEAESIASDAVTDAQNHANAAAQSAASAANFASNTIQVWSDFQNRYLGAKSSPPTVDNEGKPLTSGVLYFNTTTNQMFVFRSGQWVLAYAAFEEHDHDQRYYTKSQIDDIVQDINDDISALDQVKQDDLGLTGKATAAEYQNKTADKALEPKAVWEAAEPQELTFASEIEIDFDNGWNCKLIMGSGASLLKNPQNKKIGQAGFIEIYQNENGDGSLAFDSDWKFINGLPPPLSSTPNSKNMLSYVVLSDGTIWATLQPRIE